MGIVYLRWISSTTRAEPKRTGAVGQGRSGARPLLALARTLLERSDPKTAGLWPRAAALLARPSSSCPTRPQLLCLRSYLPDPPLAAIVHHAWSALSNACHHHAYELAPTAQELGTLFDTVGELLDAVGEGSARG